MTTTGEASEDHVPWIVYLLRCRGDRLYCGITTDLEARLAAHGSGKGAKFTRAFPPLALVGSVRVRGKSEALRLEARLKQLPKARKLEALRAAAASEAGDGQSIGG